MLKESIVFVASTGLLIFFITPSDEPAEPVPVPEAIPEVVKRAPQPSNDGWGDGVSESEDQPFVFGEPLVNLNSNYGETSSGDSDTTQSAAFANSRERAGGKGSVDAPLEFTPRAGPHPSDH